MRSWSQYPEVTLVLDGLRITTVTHGEALKKLVGRNVTLIDGQWTKITETPLPLAYLFKKWSV